MGEYKLKKNPIARVDLDGNITEIKETRKKPVARVDLSGKITDVKQPKKKKKGNFVQRGLSTAGDALISVGEGFLRTTENWADYISYKAADVADYFGWVSDEDADEWRDAIKKDIIGDAFDNKAFNAVKDESYMNKTARSVFEGTGNVLAMIGGGEVLGVSSEASSLSNAVRTGVASFTNGYGSSMSEALRNGVDYKTAKKAAIINGTAEAISEQVFNGIPGMKVENWGGKLTGKIGSQVEKYFGTKAGKLALKALDASGEGLEEIISNVLVSTGNDIAHFFDKNYNYGMENQTGNVLKDAWSSATSKESWNSFLSASLTSALVGGGNTILSNVQKNNIIKAYAEDNNMSVKEVKDMFKQSSQETANYLQKQQPKMNLGERVETEQQARDITLRQMKDNTFVQPGTETDTYQYAKSENQKVNEMNQSIVDAGGNNTQANKEVAATAKRLIEDLGFNIKFTNNQQLQEQGQNVNERNINGFVKDGTMYLNLDSNELANFTIGHETKHFFEANEEMNDLLNKSLKEYAQEKGIWDKRLAETTELYTDKDGNLIGDPETELLADLTGEVFSNYEFVNNLSVKNPSLFEKVRSFFQNLYYKATGQKEKLLIKQINDNLNKVYRNYAKNQPKQEGTKFLLSYANTAKLSEKQSARLNEAIKMKDNDSTSEEIWNKTGVMFDEGKAKLYVDDLKLKNDVENLIKTNKQIKLSELFDSKVFENYPELKDYYFEVRNFEQDAIDEGLSQKQIEKYKKVKGTTTEDNGVIVNSNLKSIDEMENVLSHEVQHLIQEINGDKTDSNKVLEEQGKKAYRNLPSEIEAEINRVLNAMTSEQRKNIDTQSIRDEILKYYEETGYEKSVNVNKVINRLVNKHGIQYSLSPKGEMVDNETGEKVTLDVSNTGNTGTLMAIHNLNEDKLKGILELGGFPVPSIAITNPDIVSHNQFGDISVLFDKSTIDPAIKSNEVYDRDVWSPTFPQIDNDIVEKNLEKVADEIGIRDYYLEDALERSSNKEDIIDRLLREDNLVRKYLDDNNIEYNADLDTYKELRELAKQNGIVKYLSDKLNDVIGEKGIYNGKEYITEAGNRRTFWQLHDKYNIENLVKNLTKGKTTGTQQVLFGAGFGPTQANMFNQFKSIQDIKKAENKIVSKQEQEKSNTEYMINLENAMKPLRKYAVDGIYTSGQEQVYNVVQELSEEKNVNVESLKRILKERGFNNVDSIDNKLLKNMVDSLLDLKNMPTDYFEAKPQRAVGLDEIQQIVIPNNLDAEFKKQLQENGLQYTEYDPSIEGDRQRVINQFDDLKFSLSQEGELQSDKYKDLFPGMTRSTTRLSDLKRKEVELPTEQEKPLKLSKNEQKQVNNMNNEYLPLAVDKDVLKVEAADIANEINTTGDFDTTKKRGWIESLKSSDAIEDKSILNNLDFGKLNYQVQSNQKSLNKANDYIERNGYENSLNHVKDLIRSEKTPSAADVALMQRMTQEAIKNKDYQAAQELIMDTAILGTDLGQAVQALSIIQRLTPEGQLKLYTKIVNRAKIRGEKAFRDVEITPGMVETVLGAYNEDGTYDQNDLNSRVAQFKQNIAEQMKSTIGDKANAWRYLSMLGNPKTHIRNVVSNVAMGWTTKVKNTMARTFETILPIKERTKTFVPASKEIRNFAKDTAIDMKGIITGENKYNEKVALEQEKRIFKSKVLEGVSRFNSAALEAEDWFFSRHAFEQNFREFLTARGIKTMEDVENNPDIVQQGKTYAVEQAEIATFRQYSKLASEISRIERNGKATKLALAAVLPFKKTPINVAKAGLKYSPLGLIKNVSYDAYQLSKGNINASQFIDNLSQGLTGTSIALVGYALAKAGILTGGSDDDKEDKYDSQLGKQNYAINIGGKSYSISWLSPTAMPLLVGANAYEKLEEEKDWSADILIDTLAKTLDPLSEMSFVSSLTDTLKSYNSGGIGMIKDMGETAAQSYILQFFPTLFSQMASTLDDTKRSTKASNNTGFKFGEETVRKIMLKIPGLRNQLEPQTDIWGNEKEQSGNIITRAVESFIAPYSKTEDITSDIDRELKRVYNQTGETGVIPGIPQAYVKKDDETYRMSASEYTQYKKTFGQIANQTMNELFNSDSYQDVSDEDKSKMIENVYKYAREQAKQEYFNSINEDFETKKSDKIDRVMEEYDITAGDYYANMEEFNYADKNPDRYLAIKQIADYKDYAGYKEEINYIKNTYSDKNERKRAVYEYINGLPLSVEQKIILQKVGANYSIKQYRGRLQSYINNLDLSRDEKIAIDKVLFK